MIKTSFFAILTMFLCASCSFDEGLSFSRQQGTDYLTEVKVKPVEGNAYIYATIQMGPANPIKYVKGLPQWLPIAESTEKDKAKDPKELKAEGHFIEDFEITKAGPADKSHFLQTISIGRQTGDKFTPAIRFGLANDNRAIDSKVSVTTWAYDGKLNYYGNIARVNTPHDFKIKLDLEKQTMAVWISARGDDDWFMLIEKAPLINNVKLINQVQVEQYPNGPAIENLQVLSRPWTTGENLRPHPNAKTDRVVGPNKGFKFQQMRSIWRKPGKHVTVAREEGFHMAFPDVVEASPGHLICVWCNHSHTGHSGGYSIIHSYDNGKTWGERKKEIGGGRISKLNDGTLVLETGKHGNGGCYASTDEGKTWTKFFDIDAVGKGPNKGEVQSHLRELPDGSWMMIGSHYPGGNAWTGTKGETLEIYVSKNRGKNWEVISYLQPWPPHSVCEAEPVVLPNGKLMLVAREDRNDSFVAIKAFSDDNGKTWAIEDMPYPIVGRVRAGLLKDGRLMITGRAQIGRAALWAWVGDPYDKTQIVAVGAHFNDKHSVGLKDDALHIDSDGRLGQYTTYYLRQPDTDQAKIEVTAEVKVVRNDGHAATIGMPFVGKIRIFPDRLEFANDPSINIPVRPGVFHTYRIVREDNIATIYVDGEMKLKTDKTDDRKRNDPWTPARTSFYSMTFGNENENKPPIDASAIFAQDIPAEVTGYSIWKRVDVVIDDPLTGKKASYWSAKDGFPDQYQLDNIVEVGASNLGIEQGYSGWTQLDDGSIFVVNYTDDTAGASKSNKYNNGVPWIRGTHLQLSDLPPIK